MRLFWGGRGNQVPRPPPNPLPTPHKGEEAGTCGPGFLNGKNTICVGATRWVALSEPTGGTGVSPVLENVGRALPAIILKICCETTPSPSAPSPVWAIASGSAAISGMRTTRNAPATASTPATRWRPARPGTPTGRALFRSMRIMIKLGRFVASFPSATWERVGRCSQRQQILHVILNGAQRSEESQRLTREILRCAQNDKIVLYESIGGAGLRACP